MMGTTRSARSRRAQRAQCEKDVCELPKVFGDRGGDGRRHVYVFSVFTRLPKRTLGLRGRLTAGDRVRVSLELNYPFFGVVSTVWAGAMSWLHGALDGPAYPYSHDPKGSTARIIASVLGLSAARPGVVR